MIRSEVLSSVMIFSIQTDWQSLRSGEAGCQVGTSAGLLAGLQVHLANPVVPGGQLWRATLPDWVQPQLRARMWRGGHWGERGDTVVPVWGEAGVGSTDGKVEILTIFTIPTSSFLLFLSEVYIRRSVSTSPCTAVLTRLSLLVVVLVVVVVVVVVVDVVVVVVVVVVVEVVDSGTVTGILLGGGVIRSMS